jgi:HlyD family secretion protein
MKKWIILAVCIAAGGLAFQKWRVQEPDPATLRLANRPTTAVAETRNIKLSVNAAGDIGPAEQVSVRPEVNGKIHLLPVDIGDQVKAGELLFTLDDRDLQTEKESQEKSIERARLELEQAKRSFERAERLHHDKLISEELFEDTRTQYKLSRNALERAEKAMELIEYRLSKTRIVAPFDCTILTRPVSAGQAVSGSGGFNSGTEVLTIANLSEMVINAHINQADVARLQADQLVRALVEAVPGLTVTGKVERIAPQATIRNNIKGFAMRILLQDVDKRIRPGMTANIEIPVASAENVLTVPLAAVFTEQNAETLQMERFVYVRNGGALERRPVRIGISDFFFAEVQQGLSPGDVVMLELPKDEKVVTSPPSVAATAVTQRPANATTSRPRGGGT